MKASGPSVAAALERRAIVTGTRAAEMRARRLVQQSRLSAGIFVLWPTSPCLPGRDPAPHRPDVDLFPAVRLGNYLPDPWVSVVEPARPPAVRMASAPGVVKESADALLGTRLPRRRDRRWSARLRRPFLGISGDRANPVLCLSGAAGGQPHRLRHPRPATTRNVTPRPAWLGWSAHPRPGRMRRAKPRPPASRSLSRDWDDDGRARGRGSRASLRLQHQLQGGELRELGPVAADRGARAVSRSPSFIGLVSGLRPDGPDGPFIQCRGTWSSPNRRCSDGGRDRPVRRGHRARA